MKKKILVGLLSVSMLLLGSQVVPKDAIAGFGGEVVAWAANYGDYGYKALSDGTVEITEYKGSSVNVTIPESLNGKTVSRIGDEAFYMSNVKSVTIPKTVKTVGADSFRESPYLTTVKFNGGTTSIGGYSFYKCKSLKSVTLCSGLESIDKYVFYECSALKSIDIPDSVSSIGGYCFSYCSALESVDMPDNLTEIQDDLFSWCTSLKSMRIPDKVKSVGWQAFSSCTSMERVIMPNSLKTIKDDGFNRCKALKAVSIPNSVTSIGDGAFENCTSLFEVVVPDSVTDIGNYAFGYIHATGATVHTKVDGFTLYGSTSFAESYASVYKLKYVDVRLTKGTVKLNKSEYAYNKKGINVDVTVTNSAGDKLEAGKDFEANTVGKLKCGKVTVAIKGMGKYTESINESIIVTPAKIKSVKAKSLKKKSVKVTWKKALGNVTGYEIQIARNKKFTKSLKTITVKKAKITLKNIKKLKSKKKYFVRVRAYKTIDNEKYYGKWSAIRNVKCK